MVRIYGKEPIRAAVLHGGPGAAGSVACVARELAKVCGVLEPLQSARSVAGQVEELRGQLAPHLSRPLTLIGHSWGAWLAALYAKEYPTNIQQIVLVGAGPFEAAYAERIMEGRMRNLPPEEGERFRRLAELARAGDNAALAQLGALADRADDVDPIADAPDPGAFPPDGALYAAVWPEAERLRASGELARGLSRLRCPVTVIHGARDPHPAAGVTEPLERQGAPFTAHILPLCGHSPFKERHAREAFYQILRELLAEDGRGG